MEFNVTKAKALNDFFNSFGLKAYPNTSVEKGAVLPYITYEVNTAYWGDQPVNIAVNLWYHTDSEAVPNAKADEIAKAIGIGGTNIACDDGVIWIKRGTPWCLNLSDDLDNSNKRRQLNITLEFLTL